MTKLIIEADLSSEELQVLISEIMNLHRDVFKKPLVLQQTDVMRRFNYLTEAKSIAVRGIREHKTFPVHMKDEAISIIQSHFEAMGKMMAAIELTYLRSKNGA